MVFSAQATYALPFYKQDHSSLVGKLLGGWQLNGIYQFDNGQPATLYQLYFNQFNYTGVPALDKPQSRWRHELLR